MSDKGFIVSERPADAPLERDRQWIRACKEIIDRCVAPDMYQRAMRMLQAAANRAADPARSTVEG